MFNNILGNDRNKKILEKAVELRKTSHSYIFSGAEGIGKKLIAKGFSKKILCLDDKKDAIVNLALNLILITILTFS